MRKSKADWLAVHAVLLAELQFRLGGEGSIGDLPIEFLAENLTDVVVANFEVIPRRR